MMVAKPKHESVERLARTLCMNVGLDPDELADIPLHQQFAENELAYGPDGDEPEPEYEPEPRWRAYRRQAITVLGFNMLEWDV